MTPPLVTWADLQGRGFAPLRPMASTASQAAPEYWAAAQRLIESDIVAQPPVRSTHDHPIWSLRRVDVDRLGKHWCFAEQGRGGAFGVAGTCRFQFLAYDLDAADAWDQGVAAIGGEDAAGGLTDAAAVRHVLTSLLLEQPRILVPGAPAEAAAVIRSVLLVLPRPIAAGYAWSTCLLQEPGSHAVSAALPAEFRASGQQFAQVMDRVQWSTPPGPDATAQQLPSRRQRSAFELLVDRAVTATRDDELLDTNATTVRSLVERTAATRVIPTVDDVPVMLGGQAERRILADYGHVVTEWAQLQPKAAYQALRTTNEPRLRQALLHGLVDALIDKPHLRDSAALLLEVEPDPHSLADRIRERINAGTLPVAPASWLGSLGISPWDHPDLYTDWVPILIDEVTTNGKLTGRAVEMLEASEPRLALEVLQDLPRLRPVATAKLVTIAARQLDGGDLLRRGQEIIARADLGKQTAEQWLRGFLDAAARNQMPSEVLRPVLYGMLTYLSRPGHRTQWWQDPQLFEVFKEAVNESWRLDEPIPSVLEKLIRSSAQPAPTEPVAATPTRQLSASPAEPDPAAQPDRGWRSRVLTNMSDKRRRNLFRTLGTLGAAAAVTGLVFAVSPLGPRREQPEPAERATSQARVTPPPSSAVPQILVPRLPRGGATFRVQWDRTQPSPDDKILSEVRTNLAATAGQHVTIVVLAPIGQDDKSAQAVKTTLTQAGASLPELDDKVEYIIVAPVKPDENSNKIGVWLTVISEPVR